MNNNGAAATGRQLSKLSFVQGPAGIKNQMMLLESHWLSLAFETISHFVDFINSFQQKLNWKLTIQYLYVEYVYKAGVLKKKILFQNGQWLKKTRNLGKRATNIVN